jgi:hypothetical protein
MKWLESDGSLFHGHTDEHFIIWMRAAFLPHLTKLYAKCQGCKIEAGNYPILIQNRYPVQTFGGTKSLVIAKVSPIGTKGQFLALAYIGCGTVWLLFMIILIVSDVLSPRIFGEHPNSSRVFNIDLQF